MDDQSPPPPLPPAGWYPNTAGRQQWWDGTAWGPIAPTAPPTPPIAASASTNPLAVAALVVGIIAVLICLIPYGVFFGGLLAVGTAVLGLYAATRNAPKKLALISAGVGALALVSGISVTATAATPHDVTAAPRSSATPTLTPTPRASFNVDAPTDPPESVTSTITPGVAVADNTVTSQPATALLALLLVKPAVPGNYQRTSDFGEAWIDVDHNGCDTRNDILARDLAATTKSGSCKVLTGTFTSPYTGATIQFQRGENTSPLVQIDHVVSLQNAWETGAQALSYTQRVTLANDPLELLAVDGKSNNDKLGSDASEWLPPQTSYACTYVARQISVKITYNLWVTQAEHDAMARVLRGCPTVMGTASPFAPAPAPPAAAAPAQPVPLVGKPAAPAAPAPAPPAAPAVVHPGAYCSVAGATGVTSKGTPMVCTTTATDSRLRWRSS